MNKGKRTQTVGLDTVVVAADEVVSCDLSGEEAMLDLASGVYYGLNGVGSAVWRQIRQPARVSDVVAGVVSEYEVEPERCERDVVALIQRLVDAGVARGVE